MRDLPGGQWSPLLIGHQWPGRDALAALAAAAENRATTADAHNSYAESLRAIRLGLLADQQGIAADAARHAFQAGEQSSRGVVEHNETKRDAYRWAHRYVAELRSALGDIARSGNIEIRQVLDSQRPPADKISAIVNTIAAAQTQANTKAAECSANVLATIETTLGTAQSGLSAREFTSANGVDLLSAFRSPSPDGLQRQVEAVLGESGSPPGTDPADAPGAPTSMSPSPVSSVPSVPSVSTGESPTAGAAPTGASTQPSAGTAPDQPTEATPAHRAATAGAEVLAAGFDLTGVRAAIAEPAPSAGDDPLAGSAASQPNADGLPTVIAPVVTAGVAPSAPSAPMTVGAPVAAASSLPAYGSDLRTPATAPAPHLVPAAAPGSASVTAAGTSTATGAPVVVRRGPGAAAGQTLTAAVAAVGGAPSATAVPGSRPENRLGRLLGSVARQQPQLRWAVGTLQDGSTLLITDLAGGWIPPGIDIPSGVLLLQPRRCTGDVATLLGPATLTAEYLPGQQLCAANDESMATSGQTWQTTPVDDLGWELAKATKWRDGLPRLVHTMAKAASARSGYLGSEINLLREHLSSAASTALGRYPGSVSAADLGNWQLLAATEALIGGEMHRANYHFAWFLAHAGASQKAGG
jgi:hypothetical protein